MPQFRYEGRTFENKVVKGNLEAISPSDCYAKLKEQNIFAYKMEEKDSDKVSKYRMKPKELAEFARQIGTMQSSGIPVIRSLDVLKERVNKAKLLRIYDELYRGVVDGNTMSEAMERCNGAFPDMMIQMFRAGEANGKLDESAMKMAKYYDSEHKIRGKIRGAMIYPVILSAVTMFVIGILFTFVLPQIFDLITSGGGELTGLTKVMMIISNVLVNYWYLVIVFMVVTVLIIRQLMIKFAYQVDKMKLKLPIFGKLLSVIYTATFARTLSSLYGSGMSMIDSVEMSAKTIGNRYLEEQFIPVIQTVLNGTSLSNAIAGLDGLEKKLISTIYVGEETGRLDFMLNQISEEYEYESATAIERMLTMLEPIMLIFMGIIIAMVLVSIMGPMTQMYSAI